MEPLASRLRPKSFDEVMGQDHLVSKDAAFRLSIENNTFQNFIISGPSGCGKSSIVSIIENNYKLYKFNATTMSVKELRKVLDKPEDIIVAIDEAGRMSAVQSDVLLPYLETERVRFIGCLIDNPFHTMRQSLISRCNIFITEPLKQIDIIKVIIRGIKYLKQYELIKIDKEAIKYISVISCGDARKALSILQTAYNFNPIISMDNIKKVAPSKYYKYSEDDKYNYASAFQNSIQASDVDSAIYWLSAWLESGEDPRYIARRLMVSASEDAAGNPEAAAVALSAYHAACEIGRPECDIILAHAVVLTASSPRNKSAACAIWAAIKDVQNKAIREVPNPLKDCHYAGASKLGYGACHDGKYQEEYINIGVRYYFPEKWKS